MNTIAHTIHCRTAALLGSLFRWPQARRRKAGRVPDVSSFPPGLEYDIGLRDVRPSRMKNFVD
ncbi:hypothetical protein [Mesorhizobium xinjiangense]|uniref:hypothetical protein n=1 Tax=Mesorhizobium xinjiangense TaxID=2678685 RepID=UPI0012ED42DF|nr:hypothetical protein [Mesorhizobium xinjiangense]